MVDETQNPAPIAAHPDKPVEQSPAPAPTPEKDPSSPHERRHIKSHLKAIGEAAGGIADKVTALKKTGLSPEQTRIVQGLHVDTAQLHLAVNNAASIPDEDDDDAAENTGGAAQVHMKPLAPADAGA